MRNAGCGWEVGGGVHSPTHYWGTGMKVEASGKSPGSHSIILRDPTLGCPYARAPQWCVPMDGSGVGDPAGSHLGLPLVKAAPESLGVWDRFVGSERESPHLLGAVTELVGRVWARAINTETIVSRQVWQRRDSDGWGIDGWGTDGWGIDGWGTDGWDLEGCSMLGRDLEGCS